MVGAEEDGARPVGPSETADVKISRVRITGFRGIDQADLTLGDGITVLVGENNAGKTSILHAIAIALGSRQGTRDDLRRAAGEVAVVDATIDLYLSPTSGRTFAD